MRATWTDSRLDDFKESVETRFDKLDGRVDGLTVEVSEMRTEIGEIRTESRQMRTEIGAMRVDFVALQRTLIQVGAGLAGVLLAGFLGVIVSLLVTLL